MEIRCQQLGDMLVARVDESRIDAAIAIQFKDRMRQVLQTPARRIVLDLSQVGFLDSSGLGAVVAVKKLAGPDRNLELAGLTATVDKVFRLTRMDRVFTILTSVPRTADHAG